MFSETVWMVRDRHGLAAENEKLGIFCVVDAQRFVTRIKDKDFRFP